MSGERDTLPQERQQAILQRLRDQGRVVAAETAERFALSEDSIRRTLRELAALGLCRRICAIDPERGLWGVDDEESLFKWSMVEASAETMAVVTSDKLDTLAAHRVEAIDRLVVENGTPGRRSRSVRRAGGAGALGSAGISVHVGACGREG